MYSVTLGRVLQLSFFSLLVGVVAFPLFFTESAHAANLTLDSVRLDRMKASTTTGGMVCAKSTTASIETTVKVTFPTGFAFDIRDSLREFRAGRLRRGDERAEVVHGASLGGFGHATDDGDRNDHRDREQN